MLPNAHAQLPEPPSTRLQVIRPPARELYKGCARTGFRLLLPLKDNQGHPHGRELFRAVTGELAERFAGLTTYTGASAGGLWREDSSGTG
jgi:hypothetical protein